MYRIRIYGDPILRKKAKKVEVFDDNLNDILEEMIETMYLGDGVGLAAPQVGLSLRTFVMDWGEGPLKVINPEILGFSEEKVIDEEGCLSLPDIFEDVERSRWIKVRFQDEKGNVHERTFEDYPARIFQHEYDHLDGILFIDRISAVKRVALKPKLLELMKRSRQASKR
ncbi:MAG: peptide deformylase [Thermotogaceae bacterium]|nr:peptide deformylase [Thermotogaceae bacterium]